MITRGEQHLYDWQYGTAGHFITHLMECISRADRTNTKLLKLSYPEHVEAYDKYHNEAGYWTDLKTRMKVFRTTRHNVPDIDTLKVVN